MTYEIIFKCKYSCGFINIIKYKSEKEDINIMTKNIIVSDIEIEVNRKKIKNMYLKVSGHDGKVSISAPLRMKEEAIIKFAYTKIHWIENQRMKYENNHILKTTDYTDGEIHYVWGKPYVLKVYNGTKGKVELVDNMLILTIGNDSRREKKEKVIMEWYRIQLRSRLPKLFEKWESIIGVKAEVVTIRNMKSRWGSCNIRDKKISINLQLAKRPEICLEYIVVHELVHLLEPSHNAVFKGYMDGFMPNWRDIQRELI